MNHSGDAAEQIVRMSLEGVEVIAKITGAAAKNIAAFLLAALKDNGDGDREQQKLKGKDRLENMLKSGKPLEIFTVRNEDLKTFAVGAKQYGIVYCVLRDKGKSPDGLCDIMVRAEDAPKINRLVERFKLANVEKSAEVASEAPNAERTAADGAAIEAADGTGEIGEVEINDIDALMADLMGVEGELDAATVEIGADDFDLSPGAVVRVDGVEYKVHSADAERVLLEDVADPLKTREINRAELETKLRDERDAAKIVGEAEKTAPAHEKTAHEPEEPAPEHSSKTKGGRRAKERGGKGKDAPARDDKAKDTPAREEPPRPDAAEIAKSRLSEPILTSAGKPARATSKPSVSRALDAITARHRKREADKRRDENELERDGGTVKKRDRATPTVPTHTPPKKSGKRRDKKATTAERVG